MSTDQMTWQERLTGSFFPAVPVTFDANGQINAEAQAQYARWMSMQPATGVAIWAHTGRGLFLSASEREDVFRTWRSNLRPEQMIICGVGSRRQPGGDGSGEEEFLSEARAMAEQAKVLGADVLLIYPPTYYRGRKDQEASIVAYHQMLAEFKLPMILFYLYAEAGGISYTDAVLRQLLDMDQAVGIKMATLDSVTTYQDVCTMIQKEFPDKVVVTGEDRFVGYTYLRGARSALVGLGSACTSLQVDMAQSYFRGDYARFVDRMVKVDKLAECTFIHPMEGYIQRMLYVLALQGIIPMEAAHDPFGPGITDAEQKRIRETLADLQMLP